MSTKKARRLGLFRSRIRMSGGIRAFLLEPRPRSSSERSSALAFGPSRGEAVALRVAKAEGGKHLLAAGSDPDPLREAVAGGLVPLNAMVLGVTMSTAHNRPHRSTARWRSEPTAPGRPSPQACPRWASRRRPGTPCELREWRRGGQATPAIRPRPRGGGRWRGGGGRSRRGFR